MNQNISRTVAQAASLGWILAQGCTPSQPVDTATTAPVATTTSATTTTNTAPPIPEDPGLTRAVNDRDFLPAALLAIHAAQSEIRVAEYLMYDDNSVNDIVWALAAAHDRGVHVQVLVDEEGDETQGRIDALSFVGVDTQFDSTSVTLHNKLIIADDAVLVGSHNFTGSALDRNREGSVFLRDAEIAAWYASWFDAVWDDPAANPPVQPWTRTDLAPLADRSVTQALVDCIDGAVTDIDVVMYALSWNDNYPGSEVDQVLTALEAAHLRGVAVSTVLDGSSWIVSNGINDDAIDRLSASGIPIWTAQANITTHAKVLRCDSTVIVGDANWSYSGLGLMHGTSVVVRDRAMAADYAAWIREMRNESTVDAR